ncbi:hypothetical protein [Achromobacter insolitus]|uniref:hypothetical protein n=1 Tax=Achromobacter insolitus TaxID=217204 RepID=UPI003671B44A
MSEDPWMQVENWISAQGNLQSAVEAFQGDKNATTYSKMLSALEAEGECREQAIHVLRSALGRGKGSVKIKKRGDEFQVCTRSGDGWHVSRTVFSLDDAKHEARALGCDVPEVEMA